MNVILISNYMNMLTLFYITGTNAFQNVYFSRQTLSFCFILEYRANATNWSWLGASRTFCTTLLESIFIYLSWFEISIRIHNKMTKKIHNKMTFWKYGAYQQMWVNFTHTVGFWDKTVNFFFRNCAALFFKINTFLLMNINRFF